MSRCGRLRGMPETAGPVGIIAGVGGLRGRVPGGAGARGGV